MRILIILLFIVSCGNYTPKPTIKHVLAVTSEGDTLLIPINRIRPNIYQSIYPVYGRVYDPYYNRWQYSILYLYYRRTKQPTQTTARKKKERFEHH